MALIENSDLDNISSNLPEIEESQHIKQESVQEENKQIENKTVDNNETECTQLRRSSRKKIRPLELEKPEILPKIKKLTKTSSMKEIKKYYLDKSIGQHSSLETIYEGSEQTSSMSTRKYRRFIDFKESARTSKMKIKKRQKKSKEHLGNKKRNSKVSMECLMKKLGDLEEK